MAISIEKYVQSIGKTYEDLIGATIISDGLVTALYEGDDEAYIEVESGLSLVFSDESNLLEHVYVTLMKTVEGTNEYKGELPPPLEHRMSQATVREKFGRPMASKGPIKLPILGQKGGWDAYSLDPQLFGQVQVVFQYTEDLVVNVIHFKRR